MGSPRTVRQGGSLWARLVGAFRGTGEPAPVVAPNSLEWRVDPDTETWWHQPPVVPAGMQEVQVRAPDGYDFARLVWQVCDLCRLGLVAKIRVTRPWQHHGYGTRMMRLALNGRSGYSWSTTPQSEDGRAFFPVVAEAINVALPGQSVLCEHMHAKEPRFSVPAQQLDPPPS
ncbi:hypothetical protein Shyd_83230 [Streptomyces hydrogenans]|uniref:GNAT family N-acetyltransferase n=1 Tax=Streptomyces hydrogenans TaxID=1873719 RepID=A0ABQ3P5Q1_9ACTN|nr:hypothetical protein Shyd_17160 [Streptomyces hydrogenans]GHI20468.1 hypothetical protein Shyd_18390 [Streptomyces hydrogenans]GHI20487.1 hypothetical protein Shyd_18580 [Streptomyces hydrogenans]GHI22947.1 hypothetical protein Shyd_43180 [Streptomyces hydrogenans]GHI23378.1 hypothetical protein Shyd_47490 [Streptomyces hydrogenans]